MVRRSRPLPARRFLRCLSGDAAAIGRLTHAKSNAPKQTRRETLFPIGRMFGSRQA